MRRVLEVAPPSIREVFDDHKGLTNALKSGDDDAVCAAITAHQNQVRLALADFLAEQQDAGTDPAGTAGAGGSGSTPGKPGGLAAAS
jgi:DNA-binding GntR family transcriptional regulator